MLPHSTDENTLLITSTLGPLKYVLKHAKKAFYPKKKLYIHFENLMGLYVNTFVIEIKSPLTKLLGWGWEAHVKYHRRYKALN